MSIILCANKIDVEKRGICFEEGKKFAKNNDLLYCETSSKEGINIDILFETI